MKCYKCGKELETDWNKCPYCGQKTNDSRTNAMNMEMEKNYETILNENEKEEKNVCATMGLVIGIVGLIFSCLFLGIIPSVIGLLLSIKGMKKGRKKSAVAGCVCSLIGILISVLVFVECIKVPDETEAGKAENVESGVVGDEITEENLKLQQIAPIGYAYAYEYLEEYSKAYDVDVCNAEVITLLDGWVSSASEPKCVGVENGGMFQADYYGLSMEDTGLYYFGKMKDNRPDGFGILCESTGIDIYTVEDSDKIYYEVMNYSWGEWNVYKKLYAGYFDKGRFDGKGILYYSNEEMASENMESFYLSETGYQLYEDDLQKMINMFGTPAKYIGKFKEGQYDGKGTSLWYGSDEMGIPIISCVITGKYKKGKVNGNAKEYVDGCLYYEGEEKNDEYHGSGKEYYYSSDQLKYKGDYKHGKYDGKGTYYESDGSVRYKGKWKNGEIAN